MGTAKMRVFRSLMFVMILSLFAAVPVWAQSPAEDLGAPACCTPSYAVLGYQQGCCEFTPTCCSQVWAGYCEMKKVRACHRWEVARPMRGWERFAACGCTPTSPGKFDGGAGE